MKTAFIALYEVFPPASGAASVSFHLARHLRGDVILFQLSRGPCAPHVVQGIRIVGFPYASDNHLLKAMAISRALPSLVKALRRERPEAVVLEGASWAAYLLLVLGALRIGGIRAPIVYHTHNVEYLLRKGRNGPIVLAITRWAEGALCRHTNLITAVSYTDAKSYREIYGLDPRIVPNGVDPDQFDIPPEEVARISQKYGISENTVLFMGLADYAPNIEAIESLVSRIFPAARRSVPDLRLAVIGGRIPFSRDWLLNPGSIAHDEVPAFVKACRLCVAPIRSGSGTRLKILEYMAAGRPVVSTTKGAEGLGAISGTHFSVADSDEDFAAEIIRLVRDPALAESLGSRAREYVRGRFSWRVIADGFEREIRGVGPVRVKGKSRTESHEGDTSYE